MTGLLRAGKAWVIANRERAALAGGLLENERRTELERPT